MGYGEDDQSWVICFSEVATDDSVAIAQRFSDQHPSLRLHIIEQLLPPSEAYIGRVRQILMDEAYHRLANRIIDSQWTIGTTKDPNR